MKRNYVSWLLLIVMLAGCLLFPQAGTVEAEGEKTVAVALPLAWDNMMPLNTNNNYSRFVYDQLYDRLVMENGKGEFEPRLAESWEVNEDSTAVTFKLAENVVWSDGEPFTADDVVFSFQMYSDPEVEALSRHYLQYIEGVDDSGAELSDDSIQVTAEDKYTVTIKMKEAMYAGTLLSSINMVFMIPKHIFEGKTAEEINAPDLWANPVGTGPFRYESEISGERMELVRNEDYFLGAPDIDRLVIRVVDITSLLAGLMSGEIDINPMGSIPLEDWEMSQEQENLKTFSEPSRNYNTILFNIKKEYQTEKFRQAVNMAINRKILVEALLQGQGQEIVTPIAPNNPYYNEEVDVWYDPDTAKKMLEEEDFDFNRELTFYCPAGAHRERAVALIAQDLAKVGLKVKIQVTDFTKLMEAMRNAEHDFGIIGSGGPVDPSESREMLAPGSSVNFCQIEDTTLIDLLDEGNKQLTFDERKPFFDEFQVKVKEISPMGYLYTSNILIGMNKRLSNVVTENFGSMNWSIWNWKVEE